jgi:hypothetical protein
MSDMRTPVWELLGMTGNEPGLLSLTNGVLSFETAKGLRFACPISQLSDVKWPWYSWNCALNLTANGEKIRLSFARPNAAGAAWIPDEALQGVFDLGGASKTGKAWRAALEGK